MSFMLQRRQVPPGQVVGEVVNRDVQRVRQAVERSFARCGKAQTVVDFLNCIDGLSQPVKDVARAVVIAALRDMGMQYATWEALRADARNIPYKVLVNALGVPQISVSGAQTSTSASRQGGVLYA
jgi:hypothetical protein